MGDSSTAPATHTPRAGCLHFSLLRVCPPVTLSPPPQAPQLPEQTLGGAEAVPWGL